MLVIPCEHCWCSGIMQDSHSCDPGSIPGQCNTFSRVPLLQMMWMTMYMLVVLCWWYLVSTAGVVVSCKIPILATRVRFPGSATLLVGFLYFKWCEWQYMLVVLCWWYLVSTAGVVVSCKIPILATRVRFPGSATFHSYPCISPYFSWNKWEWHWHIIR